MRRLLAWGLLGAIALLLLLRVLGSLAGGGSGDMSGTTEGWAPAPGPSPR